MIVKCPSCATKNKIPDTLDPTKNYRCSNCYAVLVLSAYGAAKAQREEEEFQEALQQAKAKAYFKCPNCGRVAGFPKSIDMGIAYKCGNCKFKFDAATLDVMKAARIGAELGFDDSQVSDMLVAEGVQHGMATEVAHEAVKEASERNIREAIVALPLLLIIAPITTTLNLLMGLIQWIGIRITGRT